MTIAWLRVDEEHHLTSPPTPSTPSSSSCLANWMVSCQRLSTSHLSNSMFFLFHLPLWRAIHNLRLWHRIHHVSHHILPPRDSNCWICDIIKHPVVSSLYTSLCHPALSPFPFDPLTSICSALPIAPTRTHMPSSARCMPPKVSRSLISLPLPPLLPPLHIPSPSTHPPHANTTAAIQDGRIMNCSCVYEELVKQKVFSSPAFPFLLLLFTSSYILYEIPFSFYFYAL